MKLYNSLTKKVEEFIPWNKDEVTLYTCGPTVYHYAHIGNLRTYISEDILEKSLKYLGYNVKRCMNITDVGHLVGDGDNGEDKMAVAMKREHKSVMDVAKFYTDAFKKDCEKLNITWPKIVSPATENIKEYLIMIDKLIKDGYAYLADGNVYFDTSKFNDYFALSGRKQEELEIASRDDVSVDNAKKNPCDFGLWFTNSKFDGQALTWDSPYGRGYPGWHIECSNIAIKYLGEYLDIHCGAEDAIFPHHTNEIAQSEAYLGHKWCNYWVHMGFLNDESGKMSKSKGEFLTVSLLEEKGFDPISYRFMCLESYYHKQLVFSYEALAKAEDTIKKLRKKISQIASDGDVDENKFNEYNNKFKEALAGDLNTSNALTTLYDLLKDANVNGKTKIALIESFDTVLSLDLFKKEDTKLTEDEIKYIESKILERKKAKENKDYALADAIRCELLEKNIVLKDTKDGTFYEVI